ncbi:hypothetical protein OG257_04720 [Streptomyces sp. NBC_00683]|uniref:hypothetical protein n=1 Tax=Streptomyces sp. NBC_00683 TaxID=2903670 RepID=UPI002E35AFBF|nr:hypothetical protein [Streptomyces sp. NBC_00683]
MSHPQSYEILLVPEFKESAGAPTPGAAIRSAVVAATGDTGASGYPRYAGDGMEADIDPATHTVEALLVDGAELDYGLTVRIAERRGGTGEAGTATEPAGESEAGESEAGERTAEPTEETGDR